ncbi:MAG: hypothetical protein IJI22_03985 [Bacilli bacterium]|nr:hypothetical protein [Bacilli bacterium]
MNEHLYNSCKDDPGLVFSLIKQDEIETIEALIDDNLINVNLVDGIGNDVVTRMLKAKYYDLAIKLMKKKNWDVNHANLDGDTFAHILALDDSVSAVKVFEELCKKTNYLPNIQNNNGETALDRALNNSHLYCAFKILSDKRFNNIDVKTLINLMRISLKNSNYGKYSKITNLELIVEKLEKKDLEDNVSNLVTNISDNIDIIKNDIMNNRFTALEAIISSHLIC